MKRKKFHSDPVFGDEYLKAKIKSYNNKITNNFKNVKNNGAKSPKEGPKCICLAAIVIDSIFKLGKNYYSQIFLEECKYEGKEKVSKSFVADDLESSSYGDSEKEEGKEEDFEKNSH